MLLSPEQQLLSAAHVQFIEHVAKVMAHGRGANEESAGYILIGQSFSEQGQHVRLTFGEERGCCDQTWPCGSFGRCTWFS